MRGRRGLQPPHNFLQRGLSPLTNDAFCNLYSLFSSVKVGMTNQKNALYGVPASTGRPRTTTVEASWTTNSSSVSAAFTLIGRRRLQYPEHIVGQGAPSRLQKWPSILSSSTALKDFFHQLADSEMNDVGAKAEGLYVMFAKSDTYILLSILVSILGPLETANAALQRPTLNFSDADRIIATLKELYAYRRRAGFDDVWRETCTEASALDLQEPALPRQRKIPKRLDSGSQQHQYGSPEEQYRQLY